MASEGRSPAIQPGSDGTRAEEPAPLQHAPCGHHCPVLYITSEVSLKDSAHCNFFYYYYYYYFAPCPIPTLANLLIVLKLSEFVTVTFREYCTTERNCTQ